MGRPTASLTGVPLLTAAWVADGVILKRRNPLSVRPADRAGPIAKSFTPTRLRAIPATARGSADQRQTFDRPHRRVTNLYRWHWRYCVGTSIDTDQVTTQLRRP
jgi:hypothetical protein